MTTFIQLIVDGLAQGSIYAALALAIVLVNQATGLINFAQGGMAVLSAFIAGIGGGLFAHFITSFTPKAFFLTETFVILAMLVIGGPATVSGAVIGTLLVTVIYQSLRWVENTLNIHQVFSGNVAGLTDTGLALILIAVLILRPGGFLERRELSLGGWLTRKRSADSPLPASPTQKQELP